MIRDLSLFSTPLSLYQRWENLECYFRLTPMCVVCLKHYVLILFVKFSFIVSRYFSTPLLSIYTEVHSRKTLLPLI